MAEYVCPKCLNTGFYDKVQCSCVIERALSVWLDPVLVKAPKISKEKRPSFVNIDSSRFQSVMFVTDRMQFDSLIKFYLSYKYIQTVGAYKYKYVTGREVVDSFLISGSDGDEVEREITNCDLLVLILGSDPKNKYMDELLPYITSLRHTKGKKTWVYMPPSAFNTIRQYYGEAFANRVSKGHSDCIFETTTNAVK